jgi:hypothetical protein
MNIDITDALSWQNAALDKAENSVAVGHQRGRQILKQLEDRQAIAQTSASHLADYKRMHDDVGSLQQVDKLCIATAKMIDPHARVDQDQTGLRWRLRGAAFNLGCVPPSCARRLALSRSMRALNPSLNIAVRSIGPASLVALASNSSSILTVVRMFSPPELDIQYSVT